MKKFQVLFAILLLSSSLMAQDPNFHIYLCFGQSNMEGQGTIESQDLETNDRFKVFQALDCPNLGRVKETWYPAMPPNCQCYSKLSPADNFGITMAENLDDNITVGIINVSVAGCDIRLFDKELYTEHDSTYVESWFLNKIANYEGNPYQYLINLAQLAQQDGVIKGILLHQGETNTGQSAWTSYVQKIYTDMLNDLSLNAEEVPILAGELLSAPGNCCSSMNPIINQLPNVIPTAHVISSYACGAADNAHFSSEGYRLLGKRYADKMLTLLDENVISNTSALTTEGFSFHNIYPNPVVDNTINLSFHMPSKSFISIKLFNSIGVEISEIATKEFESGDHTIKHRIDNLPAGNYYCVIITNEVTVSKPIIIQ